jgi:non-heme chloroperoxidase
MRRKLALLTLLLCCTAARAASPAIQDKSFTTSDGVKLHYLDSGTGPTLVFVPGWTMPAWVWDPQIRYFSEHYRVISLDPRSQGESQKSPEGNYCDRRARDIHELIDTQKLGPVVLIGWSLAVSELLSYAEQFGGADVRGYVLVDGLAWEKQDLQFLAAMLGMFQQLQANRRQFTDRFVRSMYKKPQSEDYIQHVIEASLKMPTDSAIAASLSSASRPDWKLAMAKLDRPVLVAYEPPTKTMAADPIKNNVPSARIEVFEDAGHALFVDDADRFNAVLEDFIKTLPAK